MFNNGHFLPESGMAADVPCQATAVRRPTPPAQSMIGAPHAVFLQLGAQMPVGLIAERHGQQPARVAVQPVHDARPQRITPNQRRAEVMQQSVDQGSVRMADRRMHHQPRRLVHHHQVVILMHDIQGNILGNGCHGLPQRRLVAHHLTPL